VTDDPSTLREDIDQTRDRIRSGAGELADRLNPEHLVDRGIQRAGDRVKSAGDQARRLPRAVRSGTQRHPLTAGALAFSAGLAVAALLPAGDRERRLTEPLARRAADHLEPLPDKVRDLSEQASDALPGDPPDDRS
jgi:hypothetical protein